MRINQFLRQRVTAPRGQHEATGEFCKLPAFKYRKNLLNDRLVAENPTSVSRAGVVFKSYPVNEFSGTRRFIYYLAVLGNTLVPQVWFFIKRRRRADSQQGGVYPGAALFRPKMTSVFLKQFAPLRGLVYTYFNILRTITYGFTVYTVYNPRTQHSTNFNFLDMSALFTTSQYLYLLTTLPLFCATTTLEFFF